MVSEILQQYRQSIEQEEALRFHPKASLSAGHRRYFGREDDHRLPYKRDVDRIVHSKAYARYIDKTQVAYLVENDHITHRSLHVQLVSNFARGIAETLRLNVDLVEAIALGHDVGHPPFGHEGENYLSEISKKYENQSFAHPLQSCRLFSVIEPLNLGLTVYDGFLCHDGAMNGRRIAPKFNKTWDIHFAEKEQKRTNPEINIIPGTLEGCLVKICDTMSYVGRDIEDAISLRILDRKAVPKTCLGTTNREILSVLAQDLIQHSYGKDYIEISEEAYESLAFLRQFNFTHIYTHPVLKKESAKIQKCYCILFELLINDFRQKNQESYLWAHFLHNKPATYLSETSDVQMVIDYISGMTDSYFIRTIQKLIIPSLIELS